MSDGSPPRVRSRPPQTLPATARPGITSACAEQTATQPHNGTAAWDHLRVCGADPPTCSHTCTS